MPLETLRVQDGLLREPELHDSVLCGFVVTPQDNLHLFFARGAASDVELVLPCVRYLRADNVREGNIVFDVHVHCGAGDPRAVIEWVLDHDGPATPAAIAAVLEAVVAGRGTVLEVSTSYGCRFAAIAESNVEHLRVRDVRRESDMA